jgi:hypothetical protein
MIRHLEQEHPSLHRAFKQSDLQSAPPTKKTVQLQFHQNEQNELSVGRSVGTGHRIPTSKQKTYDAAVVTMVIQDLLPFTCVEKEGLQNLVSTLRPGYALPSSGTLTKLVKLRFKDETQKLKQFCKAQKYLSYTADLWKSPAKDYYLSVALHFIDDNWNLHCPLIATKHVIGDHKKDTIGKLVGKLIAPFLGPQSVVVAGVTDGGEITSIKHTGDSFKLLYLGKLRERLCLCHRLNNAIKGLLKDYFGDTYLTQWRSFISRINASNPFKELFEECKLTVLGIDCRTKLQKIRKRGGRRLPRCCERHINFEKLFV